MKLNTPYADVGVFDRALTEQRTIKAALSGGVPAAWATRRAASSGHNDLAKAFDRCESGVDVTRWFGHHPDGKS